MEILDLFNRRKVIIFLMTFSLFSTILFLNISSLDDDIGKYIVYWPYFSFFIILCFNKVSKCHCNWPVCKLQLRNNSLWCIPGLLRICVKIFTRFSFSNMSEISQRIREILWYCLHFRDFKDQISTWSHPGMWQQRNETKEHSGCILDWNNPKPSQVLPNL